MPENMELRDARPGDESKVRSITLAAYQEHAGAMAPSAWEALREAIENGLDNPDPSAVRIVAEDNGNVLGSVVLFPPASDAYGGGVDVPEWPEVRMLAVDPAVRGRGIGKALMDECVRRARAMGARWLGLHTSASLRVAVAMYQRMGFERDPQHDFQPPGAELVEAYRLRL